MKRLLNSKNDKFTKCYDVLAKFKHLNWTEKGFIMQIIPFEINGGVCDYSLTQLSNNLGLNKTTINGIKRRLKALGYLKVEIFDYDNGGIAGSYSSLTQKFYDDIFEEQEANQARVNEILKNRVVISNKIVVEDDKIVVEDDEAEVEYDKVVVDSDEVVVDSDEVVETPIIREPINYSEYLSMTFVRGSKKLISLDMPSFYNLTDDGKKELIQFILDNEIDVSNHYNVNKLLTDQLVEQ